MTTGATGQLGLALPVQGELSGTWGDTVNNGITQYVNIAIAGTLSFSGDGAITLTNTTGDASATNIGSTTAQYMVIRVTGTLTTPKIITAPSYSKLYMVDNSATGSTVSFIRSGQTPAVSIAVGEKAFVYYNGTDYVKVSSIGSTGVLSPAGGGTGIANNAASTLAISGNFATTLTVTGTTGVTLPTSGSLGYLNIPQSGAAKTTSYTLAVGDVGKFIQVGASGSIVVPDATFSAGDAVVIFNNTSGAITLTMSITTAYIGGTDADKATISLATRGICNVLFISGTVCVVTGNVT